MYAIILAGGSGTRLWPLSRELYPKQFLPMPGTGDKSLIQATIDRVRAAVSEEKILVVTHVDQAGEIRRQLGLSGMTKVRLLEEPQARNTAPAIGLAAWYLLQEEGPDAVMAVLPSDHLIPDREQFAGLLHTGEAAAKAYGLVTFGIQPDYPETGFGYISCGEGLEHSACRVEKFVEKPDLETAETYLKDKRYLWNSGMFVFRVGALVEQYHRLLPEMHAALEQVDYKELSNLEPIYSGLEKISIDYGILERSEGVTVIPTGISWSDLGSWEAYYQLSPVDKQGNYLKGRILPVDTENTMVISEARIIGAIGLKDLVVVDTDDALLVCDRKRAQDVKTIVDQLKADGAVEAREHRTIYRPWGSYTSLELGETYQVKRINVNPGARLSLQSHRRRAENWVVVSGEAFVTIDDRQIAVKKGESVFVPTGARHRMENRGSEPMVLIEVQNGDYLGEDDIERYEDDYGRTAAKETSAPPVDAGRKSESHPGALTAKKRFERWLAYPGLDPETKSELQAMQKDPDAIESHFGREMVFGTGGMRDIIGPGLNRINCYTIRRATQGLADYLNSRLAAEPSAAAESPKQVAIAFDTRLHSEEFAEAAALVLAANGIKALLFNDIRPTPMLSFTTRELGCAAGIVITASHNPPKYNGYKIYGPDGGQAVSPLVDDVIEAIGKIDIFDDVKTITRAQAIEQGLLEIIDPALDQSYLERVSALSLSNPEACISVVFTPLHGTGLVYIPNLLTQSKCVDLTLVDEQMISDPFFSTVRVPNPEDPAALDMALEKARLVGAELVLATDPDGDRVGTAVRDTSGNYVILSGNQVGALLIEYICSRRLEKGILPAKPVMVKTIVTGDLGKKVAEAYGLQIIETLTGFKFIGDKMNEFDQKGTPHFLFGYEESCGYLTGTFVRDKDAVISSFMIAEMAAYYKEQGKDLLQVLDEMQQHHGYHREDLLTVELKDISEADRHVAAYQDLPPELAGQKVVEKRDYEESRGFNLLHGSEFELTLPKSQVLHYTLADGSWFAVRPSGTEPKVKFYLSVTAPTAAEADQKLTRLREAVLAQA
ncbi:MAG: mannose-1-phosphate guanylyltransferase/mannose-6-phosphate isomerase [Bacillota bacterium]